MAKVETDFIKADSSNLPRVTSEMIANYFVENANYIRVESRGKKHMRSARQSYGDSAIGYVQLKRNNNICLIKAKITPEDKVHSKAYDVNVIVNENENIINLCECEDCAAAKGGCKHAIAFLFWLHRRSEEPSPTEQLCYWKKSELLKVGSLKKFMKLYEIVKVPSMTDENSSVVIENFREHNRGKSIDSLLLNMDRGPLYPTLSLHQLFIHCQIENADIDITPEFFLEYC